MWTPDGRALAFASNRHGTWGLFTIAVDNGVPQGSPELVRDLGRSRPTLLGFTHDGTLFVRMLTDLEDVLRTVVDLAASSLGNPGRAVPTALDESNRSPDWSPAGERFAYIAGAFRRDARIVIARAHGGVERSLSFPGQPSRFDIVRWSPDGLRLAVSGNAVAGGPPASLELIDLGNGARRRVLVADPLGDLRWASDGQGHLLSLARRIHFVDLASSVTREAYRPEKPWVSNGWRPSICRGTERRSSWRCEPRVSTVPRASSPRQGRCATSRPFQATAARLPGRTTNNPCSPACTPMTARSPSSWCRSTAEPTRSSAVTADPCRRYLDQS